MHSVRFLIADSSHALQTFLQRLGESYGFAVENIQAASTPQAALDIARNFHPDFLLTDSFLNGPLSGIDLFHKVLDINPACQFGLLSQEVGPDISRQAQVAGALFLLPKPCTAQELRSELGRAMEKLSREHPKINSHVNASDVVQRKQVAQQIAVSLPSFKPGDRVVYRGKSDSVKYVILRRGELVVQLSSMPGLVPATSVQRT